jgi:hypothetical protein
MTGTYSLYIALSWACSTNPDLDPYLPSGLVLSIQTHSGTALSFWRVLAIRTCCTFPQLLVLLGLSWACPGPVLPVLAYTGSVLLIHNYSGPFMSSWTCPVHVYLSWTFLDMFFLSGPVLLVRTVLDLFQLSGPASDLFYSINMELFLTWSPASPNSTSHSPHWQVYFWAAPTVSTTEFLSVKYSVKGHWGF